nr:MAG TPA: hypothetical protein [Caudoviricetes sp.]
MVVGSSAPFLCYVYYNTSHVKRVLLFGFLECIFMRFI